MNQRGPKLTEWTTLDRMGPKWIEVDLIGLNSNCLIFRDKKLCSTNLREQIIDYITVTK